MPTVMIVDDEKIERRYLKKLFSRDPRFRVTAEAANGQEAVSLALTARPDVIIMDISMPVFDGLEASRRIKEVLPGTVILLNTAYAEFEFARRAVEYHLDAYLMKPSGEKEIFSTIEGCLRRRGNAAAPPPAPESPPLPAEQPMDLTARLLDAVLIADTLGMRACFTAYLDYLRGQRENLNYLRLQVINTIFSVEQTLARKNAGEVLSELNCGGWMQQISGLSRWSDILRDMEGFAQRLIQILHAHGNPRENGVELVASYIDSHYREPLTLEQLAALAHFSAGYLSRLFHEEKGITIKAYINQKRVLRALELLKNRELPVGEIAAACGFVNISHFNRVFKQQTGSHPANFRNGRRPDGTN